MRNKKKNNKFVVLITIAIILLVSLVIWRQQAHAPLAEKQEVTPASNVVENTTPAKEEVTPLAVATNYDIPILMYHYIRNVEDQNDKLGISLSVTPEKFASQLDSIASKGYTTLTFEDIQKGKTAVKPIILTFDDGYKDFYTQAYPELKKRNMVAVSYIIADKNNSQYMSGAEIKELSLNNIEIGSHTLSHPDLSKVSITQATSEIVKSKEKIENVIGKKVISFCYPSGKYNDEVVDAVKNANYLYAVTTNTGLGHTKDAFILNRYRMNADTNINNYIK
jgi:peptidoglycan/xylan/chitin deacetylase (PgdA/CDA1 family)